MFSCGDPSINLPPLWSTHVQEWSLLITRPGNAESTMQESNCCTCLTLIFSSHRLSVVACRPSSSIGEFEPFSATPAQDWLAVWSNREKSLEIYSTATGNWTQVTEGADSEIHSFSPTELSWPGPQRGQTVRYIHFLPLSYHDPGHREDRQWDTFILPLSYHDRPWQW